MVLTEFDCSTSTAVSRIAFNRSKREIVCQYRSNGATYLYTNVPSDITPRVIERAESKGEFVAMLKAVCGCRQVSDFPRKVRKYKSRQYKDYSNLWIQMSQSSPVHQRAYIDNMISVLQSCHPKYPPSKKPPVLPEASSASISNQQSVDTRKLVNAFSALSIEDDSDSDIDAEEGKSTGSFEPDSTNKSIQTRYLHIRLICLYVECVRGEAAAAQREKRYESMKLLWEEAWNTLFACQVSIDEWLAILLSHSSSDGSSHNERIPGKHSIAQLEELFAGLQLLVDDTERQREGAINFLFKRREYVLQKLNPMRRERDTVKASIGEEIWVTNPNPKQSYAERRKQWEEELKIILSALESIQELDFGKILVGLL